MQSGSSGMCRNHFREWEAHQEINDIGARCLAIILLVTQWLSMIPGNVGDAFPVVEAPSLVENVESASPVADGGRHAKRSLFEGVAEAVKSPSTKISSSTQGDGGANWHRCGEVVSGANKRRCNCSGWEGGERSKNAPDQVNNWIAEMIPGPTCTCRPKNITKPFHLSALLVEINT